MRKVQIVTRTRTTNRITNISNPVTIESARRCVEQDNAYFILTSANLYSHAAEISK